MTTSRVYIAHDQGLNMSTAAPYGELIPLFDNRDSFGRRNWILDVEDMTASIIKNLDRFTDDDWICCIGDPLAIGTALAQAAALNKGRVRCLRFERRFYRYEPFLIDISAEGRSMPLPLLLPHDLTPKENRHVV